MKDRGSVLVSVHSDDELYLFSSMIFNYPYDISLILTHLGDMSKSEDSYNNQRDMLLKSIERINNYRIKHDMSEVTPIYRNTKDYYTPNCLSPEAFIETVHIIEGEINKYKIVDYYMRSNKSTHQNHVDSYNISNAIIRSPYNQKMRTIATAIYPSDFVSGNVLNFTGFQDMSEEQVDITCDILDTVYQSKVIGRKTLSSSSLKNMLKFMGDLAGFEYACAYQLDKHLLYGAYSRGL